jgi:hypothetical protein
MTKPLLLVACLAALVGAARAAGATPNFPPTIQSYLGTPNTPVCQICHVGPQERGTVNTSFGIAMRSRGLVAYDTNSLETALNRMQSDAVDSCTDGVTDIQKLKDGLDPNACICGDAGATCAASGPPEPKYGCGAHIAPRAGEDEGAAGGAVASAFLALALLRRGRRRR